MSKITREDSPELWQKLGRMEAGMQNVGKQVELINSKIDRLDLTPLVQQATRLETTVGDIENRLKKTEENQSRLAWFVILAVVGAVLKVVMDKPL